LKKVFFKTFGCRTNIYDTALMAQNLKEFEETSSENDADIVVINSCTVTNGADISLKQYINRVSKQNKKIYLTGCKVPVSSENELKKSGLDGVFEHSLKEEIDALLHQDGFFIKRGDREHIDTTIVEDLKGRSRAFVKIQEGCDFECSYCIIPQARGNSRSLDESTILKQISILRDRGFSEVVLTGTNVGSYGEKSNSNLEKLILKIGKIEGIKRVRLGSIEPSQVRLLGEILDAPFFNKHLHIALQHSSNKMLEIMKRRNRFESDLELLLSLKQRGFALGTDFLVGHPKESEDIWEEAFTNFKKLPLTHIHTFVYSKREGTASSFMSEDVELKVAKQRVKMIEDIVNQNNLEFRKTMPKLEVLAEKRKDDKHNGYDQFFNKVEIKSEIDLEKKWLKLETYEVSDEKNIAVF
jgi:MiaB-like tRNA modifying enzyme